MAVRTDSPQSVGKHFARQACHTELEIDATTSDFHSC